MMASFGTAWCVAIFITIHVPSLITLQKRNSVTPDEL